MKMERKSIVIIPEYLEIVDALPKDCQKEMVSAIVYYGVENIEPNFNSFDDREKMFMVATWLQLKKRLDYSIMKRNAGKVGGNTGRGETKNRYTNNESQAKRKQSTSNTQPIKDKSIKDEDINTHSKECEKSSTQRMFDFTLELISAGVTPNIASDYMEVRKQLKAINTQTAFRRLISEINTAKANGVSADECITMAIENSWKIFKWEWYKNRQASNTEAADKRSARRRTETKATSWQDYSETF